ncbi:MAG: glycosyltransferase family 2 protein [Patescibacteria group bacterium]
MKTCVVIPVLNEGSKIAQIIEQTKKFVDLVIVVDDGSALTKKVPMNLSDQNVIILYHAINLGKGAAMKTGCQAAIHQNAEIIIIMDGDGQHKSEDIPRFISTLQKNNLDIVFGTRKKSSTMPFVMKFGNTFLSFISSFLFGIDVADTQCGFRAFRSSIFRKIIWNSTRYSVETEMIMRAGKNKLKFGEIEIDTIYLNKFKGTTFIDGIRIFVNMLIWKFS